MCKAVGLGSCAAKGPKGRKQREETGLRCGRGGVEQGGEGDEVQERRAAMGKMETLPDLQHRPNKGQTCHIAWCPQPEVGN